MTTHAPPLPPARTDDEAPQGLPPRRLARGAGVAMWRQIEQSLAEDILGGHLRGRLANETELGLRFGVNRHTVRQAVKSLADRGLVEVQHGRGTFVRAEHINYELGRRNRFAHSLARQRRVGISQVLGSSEVLANPTVREALELPEGAEVLRIDSLDMMDGRCVGVCVQYFPLPRFAGFDSTYARLGKTHMALAEHGVAEFSRKLSRVSAQPSSPELSRQLEQSLANPILLVETIYVDGDGLPVEYGISQFSSLNVQVVIEPEPS